MPELPEVETIRRDLEPELVGRRIVGLELRWPRTLDRPPTRAEAEALLVGQCITGLRRRGKYLLFDLQSGAILVIHLRMSGRLGLVAADSPEPVHLRACLLLDDGTALRFVDMRKFGRLYVLTGAGELAEVLANVGPEPLGDRLTLAAFRERLAHRRTRLKALLLDQRFLAGLGNIYVDEALFRAGLHPLRSAAELNERETARLYEACRGALTVAINNRGTTFRSYRDGWGVRGGHKELLLVYDREDERATCVAARSRSYGSPAVARTSARSVSPSTRWRRRRSRRARGALPSWMRRILRSRRPPRTYPQPPP